MLHSEFDERITEVRSKIAPCAIVRRTRHGTPRPTCDALRMRILTPLVATFLVLVVSAACGTNTPGGGCTTDQDCKGTRVCKSGECVDPGTMTDGGSSADGSSTCQDRSPISQNSTVTCADCKAWHVCVQYKPGFTGKWACYYPCTSDADCMICGTSSGVTCKTLSTEIYVNPPTKACSF